MANFIEWIATAIGSILVFMGFYGRGYAGCFMVLAGAVMVILGVGFYVHWNLHWLLGA